MRNIVLLFLLTISLSCSKDDSESEETFLQRLDTVGFIENNTQYPSYFFFYDSSVFIKNPVYDDFLEEYDCQEISEGTNDTFLGESTVKIIENNSSTLKIESTIIGITAIVEFTIDSQGYNLTLVQETLGEKETYYYSRTDREYSKICDGTIFN
ncbi:hypothetical protein OA331_02610 [Bacteroidota bacterium]|nr:hypothetical protein [Bacteroidota bacterium]